MTYAEELAGFVTGASYKDLSQSAVRALKVRVLDALGCAIGAIDGGPVKAIAEQDVDFGGRPICTTVGGGATSPDRAALYNSALVRYLDFNDSYLAKGETCHPSDNLGAVLAGSEYAGSDGKTLLLSLAIAYQVQCRLSDAAPVRAKGFDHTTQGSYAVAAGVSKALGMDQKKTANAIAISGTALNALRVTRTGTLSNWKGLAYPNTAFCATHATFLAMRGVTGPLEVFEGNKGFMDAIAGRFEIDWSKEDLERVTKTIVKRYNAEIHSQSALEGTIELVREHSFTPGDVESIEIETFDVAYNIIGGGEEGDKHTVWIKEQADHSIPYLVSAAILDGEVMPEQYLPERIRRSDIQTFMRKVRVSPSERYSRLFPGAMPCRIRIDLRDGRALTKEKTDYEGFFTRPIQWETASGKFRRLSRGHAPASLQEEIIDSVSRLESIKVKDLMGLLSNMLQKGGA
ncbi:MAG: MmgE/PrpD family protein [Deltaproteobacteria bacterium]|nr:MmgE/PrpD family protein [Deltaproteobacteria bacterium]